MRMSEVVDSHLYDGGCLYWAAVTYDCGHKALHVLRDSATDELAESFVGTEHLCFGCKNPEPVIQHFVSMLEEFRAYRENPDYLCGYISFLGRRLIGFSSSHKEVEECRQLDAQLYELYKRNKHL